jgi:3-hydroxyisobutyrate dehydrogenase-like beta-hydroxyacid dehydrogenase
MIMSETIAFIGLGNIGSAMAQRLLDAGYSLRVYNRTRSKAEPLARRGAQVVDEPRDAVDLGGIVITSLADDDALEEVTLGEHGFLDRLGAGGLHLSTSTIAPATAARLAALHEQHQSTYLGTPVLGRPEAVTAGQLWIMLAGPAAAKPRAQPVLRALGQGVFDFGEQPEAANVVKLALNFLLEAMMEALAEAFTFAEKQGIARADLNNIIGQTTFACPAYQLYGRTIAERRFTPAGFRLPLGLKDIQLVLQAAGDHTAPMPTADLLRDRLLSGMAKGRQDLDWSAMALGAAEDAGLSLQA